MKEIISFYVFFWGFVFSYLSELKYELIVDNLEVPWAFVFLPDNSILITERKG